MSWNRNLTLMPNYRIQSDVASHLGWLRDQPPSPAVHLALLMGDDPCDDWHDAFALVRWDLLRW